MLRQFCLSAAALLCPIAAWGGPTITVIPSSAPNGWGSPSFGAWQSNAVAALEAGASSYGTPGTPEYYTVAPHSMSILDNVVTGFPSWRGNADPGTAYGLAFASELGNRLHFGVHIVGNGTQFSISQLGFDGTSTDPTNSLAFSYAVGSYAYSPVYVGLNYGQDHIKGTADDVWITGGPNTQPIDELFGRGSGNAWDIYDSDPGLTRQDKIYGVRSKFSLPNTPFDFTGTYGLSLDPQSPEITGSATVTLTPVPLPAAAWGGIALLGAMGAVRRFCRA